MLRLKALCRLSGALAAFVLCVAATKAQPEGRLYGAWGLECPDVCLLTQRVAVDPEGAKVVLSVYARSDMPHLIFRFSPDAAFDQGAGLQIRGATPIEFPLYGCDEQLCEARLYVTEELITTMDSADSALFAFVHRTGKPVYYPFATDGFAAGWAALSARRQDQTSRGAL